MRGVQSLNNDDIVASRKRSMNNSALNSCLNNPMLGSLSAPDDEFVFLSLEDKNTVMQYLVVELKVSVAKNGSSSSEYTSKIVR